MSAVFQQKTLSIEKQRRYAGAAIVAFVGVALSISAFFFVARLEARVAEIEFDNLAQDYHKVLQSDMNSISDMLYTIRGYFVSADDPVEQSEFQTFSEGLRLRHPGVEGFGWAPRVTIAGRASFEAAAKSTMNSHFQITDRDASGRTSPAPDRDVYFPMLFMGRPAQNPAILGSDLASNPSTSLPVERALDTGQPAASDPFTLYLPGHPVEGFQALLPIYGSEALHASNEDPRVPLGFVTGVFQIGAMIEEILSQTTRPRGLDIYFYNLVGPVDHRLIYWHSSETYHEPVLIPSEAAMTAELHWQGNLQVADREWGMIFVPSVTVRGGTTSWQARLTLGAGLILTGFVVLYLLASLRYTLRLELLTADLHNTTENLRSEGEKVSFIARHDSLTELANRASFIERVGQAFAVASRGGSSFAILYLDLDHFKDINDTFGHPRGDLLLQSVTKRLRELARATDLIARLGGDEFAILQANAADPAAAGLFAGRIIAALVQPYQLDGNEVHVTTSIGIALYGPETKDPDAMMMEADLALYRAKDEGRNQFCFHSDDLNRTVSERVAIAEELRTALTHGELELYYQPQVEALSGRIIGLEALIRWNHPVRGLLAPSTFIPTAEKTGLIFAVGRWVLEDACRQIKWWRSQGVVPPPVAINFSAAQFKSTASLDRDLADTFHRWDIEPSMIELEITESVLCETTDAHSNILERIRNLGVRISIDDFGTGYSSLAYLSAFRPNRLKIDRQFVRNVTNNPGNAAIVRATIGLARELGIEIIAEGVETAAELAFLLDAKCGKVQGYYFSLPVPAVRITAMLATMTLGPTVPRAAA